MPRSALAGLVARIVPVALAAVIALPADAAGLGLKPGLWEVRVVKQVVDGRDMSAQMAAAVAQMQQALANLPPEQRTRIQAMLDQNGISQGANGGFRICVSAAMAKRDTPILDRNGRCQPSAVSHSGDKTTFQISCGFNGTTMSGNAETTVAGDLVTTQADVTTRTANGATHALQNETQMHFVSADCGGLKPPDAAKPPQ